MLYGRRRVGKTRLLCEFAKDKTALFFMATEESERENRIAFKNCLADYLDRDLLKSVQDLSWESIFRELIAYKPSEKKVVIMDEFQYIGKSNRAFPSILQKIWDTLLKDANVMLVLCGSIITMMKSQTLDYTSPLYGRRTAQINLKQVPYHFYSEFYDVSLGNDLINCYAMTGGVPKYIESLNQYHSFEDMLKALLSNTFNYLIEEPYFLLSKEVPEVGSYFSVLKTIANGNVKTRDIATVLETRIPNLVHYLKVLVDMDILERRTPITEVNIEKSKKVIYHIKDNYIRFWFKYMYPNRMLIESGRQDYLYKRIMAQVIEGHVAYVYEEICRGYIRYKWLDHYDVYYEKVGLWWDKHNEIDIVAINESQNSILFGECKYKNQVIGKRVLEDLIQKSNKVKWGNAATHKGYVLFSKSGFTEELKSMQNEFGNVYLISNIDD